MSYGLHLNGNQLTFGSVTYIPLFLFDFQEKLVNDPGWNISNNSRNHYTQVCLAKAMTANLFSGHKCQKQPLRGVPRKRCSENMQQIYRRTPIPKCDFNKAAEIALRHGCPPVNLLHIFRTPFPMEGCF